MERRLGDLKRAFRHRDQPVDAVDHQRPAVGAVADHHQGGGVVEGGRSMHRPAQIDHRQHVGADFHQAGEIGLRGRHRLEWPPAEQPQHRRRLEGVPVGADPHHQQAARGCGRGRRFQPGFGRREQRPPRGGAGGGDQPVGVQKADHPLRGVDQIAGPALDAAAGLGAGMDARERKTLNPDHRVDP